MCSRLPRDATSCHGLLHCAAASETCLPKIFALHGTLRAIFFVTCRAMPLRDIAEKLHSVKVDLDGTTFAHNCIMRRIYCALLAPCKIVYDCARARLLVVTMCRRVLNLSI